MTHRAGIAGLYGPGLRVHANSGKSIGSVAAFMSLALPPRVTFPGVSDVHQQPPREWAVCVYCASGPRHPELLDLARRVGEAIAERGWTLVSGGGNVSAMGQVASGARSRGGRTIGVIPKALVHRELADVEADELIVTDTMRQRKQVMEDRSSAFLALPGGIGTLEELFETWTAGYLGMHEKPVVMLDPTGHYDGLRAWLASLVEPGYIAKTALDRLVVVDNLEGAMAACSDPVPQR